MSVFHLFRGFFGVPGGRRDPFFEAMTRDDEDDEDDSFYDDSFRGDGQDPFDSAWKFGFSFSPDGMRIQEPPLFGHVLREMEEIFSHLGHWDSQSGVPSIAPPPRQDGKRGSSGNPLRDFMLKYPDSDIRGRKESPQLPNSTPFSKFSDVWMDKLPKTPKDECKKDQDLDSAVSVGGLDQVLTPPADLVPSQQPRSRSFFQSVTVTKVLKPDGTMEERRTVRDGRGNEETTVTHSRGHGGQEGPDHQIGTRFSDMWGDDTDSFTKLFGGFK
ncbi:HCLS1-associated protein X-1 isoform X1 [Corythoichthys intestinalis]|uniref:HCLS1-associated protein X-1 isoform X1 n=1 Tax=Corythoichthys intestinalis TaxID=161448 RepID=UPI0025A5C2FD|nr:HCLS1-associated protein X-1 isoform X1 [Corythoichthys intestinalis]